MVTSHASEEVLYQFTMNMATYSNMPIEWIIHRFWNSMNYKEMVSINTYVKKEQLQIVLLTNLFTGKMEK